MVVSQNQAGATYPQGRSSRRRTSRCRKAFGRMVRFTRTLERLAIGRLLILVRAFDVTNSPRATAPRLCLHVLPAGRILSQFFGGFGRSRHVLPAGTTLSNFFGRPNSRTRRILNPGTQTGEGGRDHGTTAEGLRGRMGTELVSSDLPRLRSVVLALGKA